MRRMTKVVNVGNIKIGGNEKISIQSMLNAPSYDVEGNVEQALKLKKVGCDIIRVAIPDIESVNLILKIKEKVDVSLVADIHFDYKLALESIAAGVDKIRINPGNIGDEDKIKAVVEACKLKNIPIRIGVNSGSLEKEILKKYEHPTAQALCESALYHVSLLEKFDFDDIVLSMKSSDVKTMVDAYTIVAERCSYPLHLGVTETGTQKLGVVKSAVGIGSLLLKGIGDTFRVSLTGDVEDEVECGKNILRSCGLYKDGIEIISCPTCGRTRIDIIDLVNRAEKELSKFDKNLKVAIMGCAVNGPGEAREADLGIAGGDGCGILFKKGKVLRKVKETDLLDELIFEIEKL